MGEREAAEQRARRRWTSAIVAVFVLQALLWIVALRLADSVAGQPPTEVSSSW